MAENDTKDDTHLTNDNDWEVQRDASKALGDTAFRSGKYEESIQHYTTALSIDPDHAALLSNRSAAYLLTSQKSLALYDAEACVKIGTMGNKGISRLAAALQSLGRYQLAIDQWKLILESDPNNAAAIKGRNDCAVALQKGKEEQRKEKQQSPTADENDDTKKQEIEPNDSKNEATNFNNEEDDLLDEFFNDVQEVSSKVVKEQKKDDVLEQIATNAIKNHKSDLRDAVYQIQRLLPDNYFWFNLNPFHVLDIPHTSSMEEISRRYKALSLLLHPDKNPGEPRAQEAYDEVLKAKAILLGPDSESKVNHIRALIEEGNKIGATNWKKASAVEQSASRIEEFQKKAVLKVFADIEYKRRQVERNEKKQKEREQQQEDEIHDKEVQSRQFDKNWTEDNRVNKRVGNWRDFHSTKNKKR